MPEQRPEDPQTGGPARLLLTIVAVLAVAAAVIILVTRSTSQSPTTGGARDPHRSSAQLVPLPACGAVCAPIDAAYLTDLGFGKASFWIQPWRAYLDTWPASRLLDALGINFNAKPAQAEPVARVLHEAGFQLARIGLSWGSIDYYDQSRFTDEAAIATRLEALKRWRLRPLIILDANSQAPCPHIPVTLEASATAEPGATTIQLTPQSAAQVVPGKTGLDSALFNAGFVKHHHPGGHKHNRRYLSPSQRRERHQRLKRLRRERGLNQLLLHGDPAILITHVSPDGTAQLSRPLPSELDPGPLKAVTLRYAPFELPTLADGSPNPRFQETLAGWLRYVQTVSTVATRVFGSGGFDLEVWNELSFGSQFLDASKYTGSRPAGERAHAERAITKAILAETVAWVRNPEHGLAPSVGITNGFASQSPFPTGAYSPAGLTAISKHPYAGLKVYPEDFTARPGRVPLNFLGERATVGPRGSPGAFTPVFVPSTRAMYPEYRLGAEAPDTLVRDIAPITTHIYGAPHGRYVHASGSHPVQTWVTEYNLGSLDGEPTGPDGVTPLPGAVFGPRDREHFETKTVLRSLVSFVAKGVAREYFYAATNAGDLSLIPPTFSGGGLAAGGEVMAALARLVARFQGPGPGPQAGARQLTLKSVTQQGEHAQFAGDPAGGAGYPPLLDREVFAFFPFQRAPNSFVIPFYVMTHNLMTDYDPAAPAGDRARYDLPPETFRVTVGNLPTGPVSVRAYDPITGQGTPASLIAHHAGTATFKVAATDYPRLLELTYR
jgi:hypothetical protein